MHTFNDWTVIIYFRIIAHLFKPMSTLLFNIYYPSVSIFTFKFWSFSFF